MINTRRYGIFWGILLISVGGLFLLSPLGLLSINNWNMIFPAFLVFWGLWMLIGMFSHSGTYNSESESVNIPLHDAERARVQVYNRGGRLQLSGYTPVDQLVEGTFGAGVDYDIRRDSGSLDVDLSDKRDMGPRMFNPQNWWRCERRHIWSRRSNHWNLRHRGSHGTWPRMFGPWNWNWRGSRDWDLSLNGAIPLELSVDTRFCETQIDLSALRVTDLKLQTNMSATKVTLPAKVGHTRARIHDTMSDIKVYVPEGVAARIHTTSGRDNISVNEDRFPHSGSVYQSPDYDTTEYKVDIDAATDMGTLKIV
jgi:hypothetical protein